MLGGRPDSEPLKTMTSSSSYSCRETIPQEVEISSESESGSSSKLTKDKKKKKSPRKQGSRKGSTAAYQQEVITILKEMPTQEQGKRNYEWTC